MIGSATRPKTKTKPVVHAVPENDEREHRVSPDGKCWCGPEVDLIHGGKRVTHYSADGREFVEDRVGEKLDADKTWGIRIL